MREIKFRAWDKMVNKMSEVEELNWFEVGAIVTKDYQGSWDRFKLMQYTGLKDRNGKEIYEGDIVTRKSTISDKRVPTQVLFEDGLFYPFGQKAGLDAGGYAWEVTECEVIGNIYENPELLK